MKPSNAGDILNHGMGAPSASASPSAGFQSSNISSVLSGSESTVATSVSVSFPCKVAGRCIVVDAVATKGAAPCVGGHEEVNCVVSVDLGPSCSVRGSSGTRGVEDGSGDCGGDTVVEVLATSGDCGCGGVLGSRTRFLVLHFASLSRWSPNSIGVSVFHSKLHRGGPSRNVLNLVLTLFITGDSKQLEEARVSALWRWSRFKYSFAPAAWCVGAPFAVCLHPSERRPVGRGSTGN